ncbi:MAG: leucine-rich repeat domain-containing protein [Clostridia bacterium]|nr:leucine-rich repeat domain-containing protein [Clostridia bacterium]
MKKKIISMLLVVVMLISVTPVSIFAEDDILNYLTYEISNGEVTITNCDTSYSGPANIPNTIDGYPVSKIGASAFWTCSITSLTVPNNVTSIGQEAFSECRNLESISLGTGLTAIGYWAFESCSSLKSVEIPEGITYIATGVFRYCNSLANVTLHDGITTIDNGAFNGCAFSSITLPSNLTTIGNGAFRDCTNLTSISIPASVTSIGTWPFSGCSSLSKVTISSSNQRYSSDGCAIFNKDKTAIETCCNSTISSYDIPDGVINIADYAFYNCSKLTNIKIPDSVTSIGESAFSYCLGLSSITISSSVTTIGDGAFSGCSKLTSITLPKSIRTIDSYAFNSTTKLTDVYYYGSETEWSAITIKSNNNYLTSATIHYNYCPHTETTTISSVAPTCTQTGLTAGTKCSSCGEILVEQTVVAAKGHSYGSWTKVDDTNHKRICTRSGCGISETSAHTWNSGVITTAATCTTTGVKTYTCSICNATKTETISKLGHSYGSWTKVDDTNHKRTCTRSGCGESETSAHTWNSGVITTAATCTTTGVKTYTCSICNATKTETISKLGHDMSDWTVTTPATCTTVGEERSDCSRCDYYETRETAIKEHDDTDNDRLCDNCKDNISDSSEDVTSSGDNSNNDESSNNNGPSCFCACHSNNPFISFFYKIIRFIRMLFGLKYCRYCDCSYV